MNVARANLAGWRDWLMAATLLLGALAIVRTGLAGMPWDTAKWVILAAGSIAGFAAARAILARLAFHAADGLLAAEALHPRERRNYAIVWHAVANLFLVASLVVARPSLLIFGVAGYFVGALGAWLRTGFRLPGTLSGKVGPKAGRAVRAWLHRPPAGVAAGLLLLVALIPERALATNALMAVLGLETLLLALALTVIDHATIRFMAATGHNAPRMILHHAGGLIAFITVAVPGSWLSLGSAAAALVASLSLTVLLLLALRILAYRLYAKRVADLMLSILAGIFAFVAFTMPIALPVVVIAVLWHLQKRGRAKLWLLT